MFLKLYPTNPNPRYVKMILVKVGIGRSLVDR